MLQRRTLLAGTAAAAALAAARVRPARAADGPYIMGTLFPMAGPNAEYGTIFTNGVQMALDHMAADKTLSRPVELRAEDSQGTPQGGATGMNKLVNVHAAQWVTVGFTGVSKAAAPIGTRAKVVMVNGGGVGPDLSGLSPYYWNVIPLIPAEVATLIPWLAANKLGRIGLVYVDDPLGNGVLKLMGPALEKGGAKLVGAYSIAPSAQQLGAVAAKLRDDKPDAVYFVSYGAQQSQIIKQLRDAGIDGQLLTYSAGTIPSVAGLKEAEGLVLTSQSTDWNSDDPVTRRFVSDWRARHGSDPSPYNANYYNAARLFGLLAAAAEKGGGTVGGDTLRAELLKARAFPLVGGEGRFSEAGDIALPMQVNRIQAGKVVKIG